MKTIVTMGGRLALLMAGLAFFVPLRAQVSPCIQPHSALEAQSLAQHQQGQRNRLVEMMASHAEVDSAQVQAAQHDLESFLLKLDPKVEKEKALADKVKVIFAEVKRTYLIHYLYVVPFHKAFSDQAFNCLTGTSLLGLVLDHYRIPYDFKMQPQHVYLIADPQGEAIRLDCTDPRFGYYHPGQDFQRHYMKVVLGKGPEAYSEASFNQLFYTDKVADWDAFIHFHYMNMGVKAMEENRMADAAQLFAKAMLYQDEEISRNCLFISTASVVYAEDASHTVTACDHAWMMKTAYNKDLRDACFQDFYDVTRKMTTEEGRGKEAESLFKDVLAKLDRAEDQDLLRFYHHWVQGERHFLEGRMKKARAHLLAACRLQPGNLYIQRDLIKTIKPDDEDMDPAAFADSLNRYAELVPALNQNHQFLSLVGLTKMATFAERFKKDDAKGGEASLAAFEQWYQGLEGEVEMQEEWVEECYSDAMYHYIRKQNYTKAEQVLASGLKLFPDSEYLSVTGPEKVRQYRR